MVRENFEFNLNWLRNIFNSSTMVRENSKSTCFHCLKNIASILNLVWKNAVLKILMQIWNDFMILSSCYLIGNIGSFIDTFNKNCLQNCLFVLKSPKNL